LLSHRKNPNETVFIKVQRRDVEKKNLRGMGDLLIFSREEDELR